MIKMSNVYLPGSPNKFAARQGPVLVLGLIVGLGVFSSFSLAQSEKPEPLKAPFSASEAQTAQSAWAAAKGVQGEYQNSIGMKLVLIPPGTFEMGSPESEEVVLSSEEDYDLVAHDPQELQHTVTIRQPFFIGTYEVTQEEYVRVMGANPSRYSSKGEYKKELEGLDTNRFPVEQVSWDDAQRFIEKLNEIERDGGGKYRLPTEAEWEYACRGGTSTRFSYGPSLNDDSANFGGTATIKQPLRPEPVGRYSPNGFGLFDMHGNVSEWCQDLYDESFYQRREGLNDPVNTSSGHARVERGGGFFSKPNTCRSAQRSGVDPTKRDCWRGFRVVRTLE